jgi:16S rRNA (guanine527-N7)-methyltransferase
MNNMSDFNSRLSSGAVFYGLSLDERTLGLFHSYYALLCEWNTRMNLISSRDLDRFVEYHLLDSLKAASCVDLTSAGSLMDFGSGAGLPGIPLALAFPHLQVSLVESIGKKCAFLENAVKALSLTNTIVLHSRIENLPSSLDCSFDVVITRATVRLDRFHRVARRFLSSRGTLIAIKGDRIDDELSALVSSTYGSVFHITSTHPHEVPGVRTGHVVISRMN